MKVREIPVFVLKQTHILPSKSVDDGTQRARKIPVRIFVGAGVAMVVLVVGVFAALAHLTTTTPLFCLSCHGTGETPDMSVQSLVHPSYKTVGCVQCHAKSDRRIFTISNQLSLFTDPYRGGFVADGPSVSANCLICHQDMLRNDQTGFKYDVQNIRIPHKFHLEVAKAICTDCHKDIAHDRSEEPTNRPKMEYCMKCHDVTSAQNCSRCHAGPAASTAAAPPVVAPDSAQAKKGQALYGPNCIACHGERGNRIPVAPLNDRSFLERAGYDNLVKVILEGKGRMLAFGTDHGGSFSTEDAQAVVDYLRAVAQGEMPPEETGGQTGNGGQGIYTEYCAICHGDTGDRIASAPLFSKDFLDMQGDNITNVVTNGVGAMPPMGKAAGGNLSADDIQAAIQYLKSGGSPAPVATAAPTDGQGLYSANCAMCHGPKGDKIAGANLASKSFLAGLGGKFADSVANGKGTMPPFGAAKGGSLTDDNIKAILDYLNAGAQ